MPQRAGMGGSLKFLAILSDPAVASKIAATTATITFTTNQGSGTVYIIVDTNALEPTPTQIKTGLEQAGGAADFDDSRTPQVRTTSFDITGLVTATTYDAYIIQENSAGDSNISNVQFLTL